MENSNLLIGRKPIEEALIAGREIERILVLQDAAGSIKKILGMAKDKKIRIDKVDKARLDRQSGGKNHQGIVAYVQDYRYVDIEDILELAKSRGEAPFVVLLEEIEDPHNLGAIMRSAEVLGAHGVVIPKRRAAQVSDTVLKTAAGAGEYILCARVANLVQAIEHLQEEGVWIYACDMGDTAYYEQDFQGGVGIVIGNEGKGIGRLVKERCDFTISIPMYGRINSLNASNAAAIVLAEVAKKRHGK